MAALAAAVALFAQPARAAEASVSVVAVAGPWVGVEFSDDGVLIGQSATVDLEVSRRTVDGVIVTRIIAP